MYVSIGFSNGQAAEGVLLAVSRDRMRLALPGRTDTLELHRAGGDWHDEDGKLVFVDLLWQDGSHDPAELREVFPRVATARE